MYNSGTLGLWLGKSATLNILAFCMCLLLFMATWYSFVVKRCFSMYVSDAFFLCNNKKSSTSAVWWLSPSKVYVVCVILSQDERLHYVVIGNCKKLKPLKLQVTCLSPVIIYSLCRKYEYVGILFFWFQVCCLFSLPWCFYHYVFISSQHSLCLP